MNDLMTIATPAARPRATGGLTLDLDASIELVQHALLLLEAARRRAGSGIRAAGPDGDELRALVAALVSTADADVHHARIVLDRLLRTAGMDGLAPRPVIELPAAD